MIRTPNQWKAVEWFAKENNAVPQLSVVPNVTFKLPDGTIVDKHLEHLVMEWERWREKNKKAGKEA